MAEKKERTRRELLRDAGRLVAAGGLAGLTGLLIARSLSASADGECGNRYVCRGCRILDRCRLPEALRARGSKGIPDAKSQMPNGGEEREGAVGVREGEHG